MASPEITTAINFYAEVLSELGVDPESIAGQLEKVDHFLTNPPSGMEIEPEKRFAQVVGEAIEGLPK